MNEYPSASDIKTIIEWDAANDPFGLMAFVKSVGKYWPDDYFWSERKKSTGHTIFDVSTGGWSGNEEIIGALMENRHLFWALYWAHSSRGGHYVFDIDALEKK